MEKEIRTKQVLFVKTESAFLNGIFFVFLRSVNKFQSDFSQIES